MSDLLKTSYGTFEDDDFVEENGQLRELTVRITLSEYRELVASSVLQRDYIDQIDELTKVVDELCELIFRLDPGIKSAARTGTQAGCSPETLAAISRAAKAGDADA